MVIIFKKQPYLYILTHRNTKIYPANLKGDVAFSVLVRGSCHQPSCKSSFFFFFKGERKKKREISAVEKLLHQRCFSIADLQTHERQSPVFKQEQHAFSVAIVGPEAAGAARRAGSVSVFSARCVR